MKVFLSPPHMSGYEKQFIDLAFDANFIAPAGPQLDDFERAVVDYINPELHAVAVSSGTAALHLALLVCGVEPGDEVWSASLTFAGGVFPLYYAGAYPKFFDVARGSWNIDSDLVLHHLRLASRENRLPKAIIITELYGAPFEDVSFFDEAAQYGVKVICDSAESFGSINSNGMKSGALGDCSILSFNGNKIITTSGGGMLVTRHSSMVENARYLASQARDPVPYYLHRQIGFNYRMSNVSAAIGLGQMQVIEDRVERRRQIFERYRTALEAHGFVFIEEPQNARSSHWLSVMLCYPEKCGATAEHIRKNMMQLSIEARRVWNPMHLQPVFADIPYIGSGNDEHLFAHGLCLPSGSAMTVSQQDDIIDAILSACSRA